MDAAKSPSARCKPASTSNIAALRSDSPGKASTKWTKSPATDPPSCSTTAQSKSSSPIATATRPSSKPNAPLLQQPARAEKESHECPVGRDWPAASSDFLKKSPQLWTIVEVIARAIDWRDTVLYTGAAFNSVQG